MLTLPTLDATSSKSKQTHPQQILKLFLSKHTQKNNKHTKIHSRLEGMKYILTWSAIKTKRKTKTKTKKGKKGKKS